MKLETHDVTCACTKRSIGISGYHSDIPLKEASVRRVSCFESSGIAMIGRVVLVLVLRSVVKQTVSELYEFLWVICEVMLTLKW